MDELSILTPAILAIALGVLAFLAIRPSVTRQPAGKVLAFVGVFLLPALALGMGFDRHVERAKQREFCTSCHVMEPYGRSLHVDDDEFVPALHYQNNWVPREKACYTCHTNYSLFGGMQAKLRGLRHLAVQYAGSPPDTIRLYEPYHNRECLHCHAGARRFVAEDAHTETDTTMASMLANRLSCLSAGCHDVAHEIRELGDLDMWREPTP